MHSILSTLPPHAQAYAETLLLDPEHARVCERDYEKAWQGLVAVFPSPRHAALWLVNYAYEAGRAAPPEGFEAPKVSRDAEVWFDDLSIGELWQFLGEGEDIIAPSVIEIRAPNEAVRYGIVPSA